ncbi:hypothetical protein GE253_21880 [Niveispirillum sp. SYP-B3756]|nr:hypothetical protein [Niveispirillum sp. SYP-B3756]
MAFEGRLVRLAVAPDLVAEFLERVSANVAGSRQEPQNITFGLARSPEEEAGPDDQAVFYLWEEFRGEGAFAHHHGTAHFQAFRIWLEGQQQAGRIAVRRLVTQPLLRD